MTAYTDTSKMFLTNVLILGFDPAALEAKTRICLNKDTFKLPNKKACEAITHFLFSRLDAERCNIEFRNCWPVHDKKDEQVFRKVCTTWLLEISKNSPDANLPRINTSLLLSPGGDKFVEFLFYFSAYVLKQVAVNSYKSKLGCSILNRPELTSRNTAAGIVMLQSQYVESKLQMLTTIKETQEAVAIQNEWLKHAEELTKDYRLKRNLIRERSKLVAAEKQRRAERASAVTSAHSPQHARRKSDHRDDELATLKRTENIQNVRRMWKAVDDFSKLHSNDREIIESILDGTLEKYRIDSTQLEIRVPDMLISSCQEQLQQREVNTVYRNGKLDIVSLIHVWNLSLHLSIEKLREVGVPVIESVLPDVMTRLHTHRAHLTESEALRRRLESDMLPQLKRSIHNLRRELDQLWPTTESPAALRLLSFGLGLVPPTPPINFNASESPAMSQTNSANRLLQSRVLQSDDRQLNTPEGAAQLISDVGAKVEEMRNKKKGMMTSSHGLTLDRFSARTTATHEQLHFEQPRKLDGQATLTTLKRNGLYQMATTPFTQTLKPVTLTNRRSETTAISTQTHHPTPVVAREYLLAQNVRPGQSSTAVKGFVPVHPVLPSRTNIHEGRLPDHTTLKSSKSTSSHDTRIQSWTHKPPRVDRHYDVVASNVKKSRRPDDILVDRIVKAVMSDAENIDNCDDYALDPVAELNPDAFRVGDRLQYTPPSGAPVPRRTWHNELLEGRHTPDGGPLSSTMEAIPSPNHPELNKAVAAELFSAEDSGSEDKYHPKDPAALRMVNNKHEQLLLNQRQYIEKDPLWSVSGVNTPSSIHSESSLCDRDIVNSGNGSGTEIFANIKHFINGYVSGSEHGDRDVERTVKVDRKGIFRSSELDQAGRIIDTVVCGLRDDLNVIDDQRRDNGEHFRRLDVAGCSVSESASPSLLVLVQPTVAHISSSREEMQPISSGLLRNEENAKVAMPDNHSQTTSSADRVTIQPRDSYNANHYSTGHEAPSADSRNRISSDFNDNYTVSARFAPQESFGRDSANSRQLHVMKEAATSSHLKANVQNDSGLITSKQADILVEGKVFQSHVQHSSNEYSNGSNDLDSIIARYRKLRLQSNEVPVTAGSELLTSMLSATDNIPVAEATCNDIAFKSHAQPALLPTSDKTPVPTRNDDVFKSPTQPALSLTSPDSGRTCNMRESGFGFGRVDTALYRTPYRGLDEENFDDIRTMLLNVSGDSPSTEHLKDEKSPRYGHNSSAFISVPMSPLTRAVHSSEVSFSRSSNKSFQNLLDEGDSLLIPVSPAESPRRSSVPTAKLLDL